MVSVIIPVYNGASYVAGAIKSVLSQSFTDHEMIVVDDGSTDKTREILEPWIRSGKIKYIYQENKGLSGARNTGIRNAQGQYLKFLDCDDELYPQQLERQVDHLRNKPEMMISVTDYDLEFPGRLKKSIKIGLGQGSQLARFIEANPCPPDTILVRRSLVEKHGGFDENLTSHEDTDLWLRILAQGGVFERVDHIGCIYRIIGSSLSANSDNMFINYCRVFEKLNRILLSQIDHLRNDVFHQLILSNTKIIHMCFARKLRSTRYLPLTLRVTKELHHRTKGLGQNMIVIIVGIKNLMLLKYYNESMKNKKYRGDLLNITWWRDEQNYVERDSRLGKIRNILYVNSSSVLYGAETRLMDIIRHLDRERFRPVVLLPQAGPLLDRLNDLGVATLIFDYKPKMNLFSIKSFLRLTRDFVQLIRQQEIDLLHFNMHFKIGNLWLALLMAGKPVVVHLRTHYWIGVLEKFIICRVFKAICVSKEVERAFLAKRRSSFIMGHRPAQTQVVYDGVDLELFSPKATSGEIRKEFNVSSKDYLVALIGAVDQVKGQDILVKAAGIVAKKHPQVKIIIVGDIYGGTPSKNKYRADLLDLIKDLHMESQVIMTGFRQDIGRFMNEIDLLVQPSEREALGTSMVEAMACGKPVIGTNVDGIPEVIGDNEAGILLEPRSPEALAKAINYFIENPQEAHTRGIKGRERAAKMFDVRENIKLLQYIYNEALESRIT
jgi:glycosyltransferase involved in cell wall biosynthesis/GT2 family glycosyltransferase